MNISIENLEYSYAQEDLGGQSTKHIQLAQDSPTKIYDDPADFLSESEHSLVEPEQLFGSGGEKEEQVERRVEILELHDLLIDELCIDEKIEDSKVMNVEMLDEGCERRGEVEEVKEMEGDERGVISDRDDGEEKGEEKKLRPTGTSQAGAFSQMHTDRID